MIHLIKRLQIENGRYGVAAIPAAGGIGEAVLVKTVTANKTPMEDLGNNG